MQEPISLEPKDFLNLKLTGQFAAGTDSIVLHWVTDNRDIHNIHYSDRLLRMAGLEREKLPDLFPRHPHVGADFAERGRGVGAERACAGGHGHAGCAVRGIGLRRGGGWGGPCLCGHIGLALRPCKKTDLFHNMASLPSPLPGRYYLINEQEMAGGCLAWSQRFPLLRRRCPGHGHTRPGCLPPLRPPGRDRPPGSHGLIFAPWLNGERSPVEDHHLRGGFHNLSISNSRGDLVRAVYEGVALNARWLWVRWSASWAALPQPQPDRRRGQGRHLVPNLR